MPYLEIDPILYPWAKEQDILVLTEDIEPNRRYFYISSPAGETFQIVIEPQIDDILRIDVHLIETQHDQEKHDIYETTINGLQNTLDRIVKMIIDWFGRS